MLCCFRAEHLEPPHLHMCCWMRCMFVEGCGKVPHQRPSGGTTTFSSFDHPARALLHRPMPCTYLDTIPETVASSAAEETGLGRQEPCDRSAFPASLCIFSWQPLENRMAGTHPMRLCSLNVCRYLSSSTLTPAGHGHIFPPARKRPCAASPWGSVHT